MRLINCFLFVFSFYYTFAQQDSAEFVKYTPDFRFDDGIYLKLEDVKSNNPLPLNSIILPENDELTSIQSISEYDVVEIYDKIGNRKKVDVSKIWGFSDKGILYINYNDEFNRIPVLGKISFFSANLTYKDYHQPMYSPYTTNYEPYTVKTELRQYLLDFETGKVYDFSTTAVEAVLIKDNQLFEEFDQLSRRKKKKKRFKYIREFNNRNPLFFPLN